MNNLAMLTAQPTEPADKEHLQRCFAQADLRSGKALRQLLERLPIQITKLSEGYSFPIFELKPSGRDFTVRLKHTELILLLGLWRESLDRLELLPGNEQLAFTMALDEATFRQSAEVARRLSKAIKSHVGQGV